MFQCVVFWSNDSGFVDAVSNLQLVSADGVAAKPFRCTADNALTSAATTRSGVRQLRWSARGAKR